MLTITIFAAGLVCLAGVLGLRLGRAQAQASTVAAQASSDERGITLQTLIVTAVLVLMAVAAGVVIVAITNSASEDLNQANPGIESLCNPVETYNPVLAAQGTKGSNGGANAVSGTLPGCTPVCIWKIPSGDIEVNSDDLSYNSRLTTALGTGDAASGETRIFTDATTVNDDVSVEFAVDGAVGVRVNAARDDCITVNSDGKEVS